MVRKLSLNGKIARFQTFKNKVFGLFGKSIYSTLVLNLTIPY